MRYIFLDTNVFYDHWQLDSATFQLLATFLPNSNAVLVIPEIICLEVQNLYHREQGKQVLDLKRAYDKIQKFNAHKVGYDLLPLSQPYDFRQLLLEKLRFVTFVPYDHLPHTLVVNRALGSVMPFRDNEKGYRDTLIWLSLLDFLQDKTSGDELFFITENTTDFIIKDKIALHLDLVTDLQERHIDCHIKPYNSLNAFLADIVENGDYHYSDSSIAEIYLYPLEITIEKEVASEIGLFSLTAFKQLLDDSGEFRYIYTLLEYFFEIIEGIEDPAVINFKRLSATTFYITYAFNLRICDIQLTIPSADYYLHKFGIDIFYNDVAVLGEETYLRYYCRPQLTIGFILDTEQRELSGFEILSFKIRHIPK